jgi:hypothetical protein
MLKGEVLPRRRVKMKLQTFPMPRRVVVTGMGAVAPNGIGVDAYRTALRDGTSGIGVISLFETDGLQCRVAAEVKNFAAEDFLSLQEMRRVGRAVPLLIAATHWVGRAFAGSISTLRRSSPGGSSSAAAAARPILWRSNTGSTSPIVCAR